MRVLMTPNPLNLAQGVSGIHTLVRKYAEHLPKYGIQFVDSDIFDVQAIHAGMSRHYAQAAPIVSHLHGLYWTADYPSQVWQHKANRDVIDSIRHATLITVPSPWVATTLQRDMHINPIVVPHGIDYEEWRGNNSEKLFILWNKNRNTDVCSPIPVRELAKRFPSVQFVSTFYLNDEHAPNNVDVIGLKDHAVMKQIVERCGVYLSTTKETFCIGALEAMAAGKPILCFNEGNITELVEHGVTGYIANCYNYEDLAQGLDFCIRHRATLGANAREAVKKWTWDNAAKSLFSVYSRAIELHSSPSTVTVVIPCYNKASTLKRAVDSALNQTLKPRKIIIVNNNSTDDSAKVAQNLSRAHPEVCVVNEEKQGVAHARNRGIYEADTKYICCLDADDEIEPEFLSVCVVALQKDETIGLAYTKLTAIHPDGRQTLSAWPGEYNYDGFLKRQNQVPTCCVFRRKIALRMGGYRQRYAPDGAGAEDAEFWLRIGSSGFGGVLADNRGLFRYHIGGSVSGNPNYQEKDWLAGHAWVQDSKHPFASLATPHNGIAHDVPQYDQPIISVVIPVGPGHEDHLITALDSVESQLFRKWEVIVVLDNGNEYDSTNLRWAYPFVRFYTTKEKGSGPGVARNIGASHAKGKYLLFLDSDDSLVPEALQSMYNSILSDTDIAVYSDYMAMSYVNKDEIDRLKFQGRFVEERNGIATVIYNTPEYDCELAKLQPKLLPNNQFYIWSLISTLHPKSWWEEVGGFDESMESWEDWDYWLRLARKGKCFTKISAPLLVYRFHTGSRRSIANPFEGGEKARQLSGTLLEYLSSKRDEDTIMACGGCGSRRTASRPPVPAYNPQVARSQGVEVMPAGEQILVELTDGNIGDHPISVQGTFYGYRRHGDVFLIHRSHFPSLSNRVKEVTTHEPPNPNEPTQSSGVQEVPPDPEPVPIVEPDNLKSIWGINEEREEILHQAGIRTFDGLLTMTPERLSATIGVSNKVANRILTEAKS